MENLPDTLCQNFEISESDLLLIAANKGLDIQDTSHISIYLSWIYNYDKQEIINNGYWQLYVLENTKIRRKKNRKYFEYSVTKYYNLYIFNPWTGNYIEKKKLQETYYNMRDGSFVHTIPTDYLIKSPE